MLKAAVIILVCCSSSVLLAKALEEEDVTLDLEIPESSADHSNNCFRLVDGAAWPLLLRLNASSATLTLHVAKAGKHVRTCLQGQQGQQGQQGKQGQQGQQAQQAQQGQQRQQGQWGSGAYRLDLLRQVADEEARVQSSREASASELLLEEEGGRQTFRHLYLPANYSMRFRHCSNVSNNDSPDCESDQVTQLVTSGQVNTQSNINDTRKVTNDRVVKAVTSDLATGDQVRSDDASSCAGLNWSTNSSLLSLQQGPSSISFRFSLLGSPSCSENASVSLLSTQNVTSRCEYGEGSQVVFTNSTSLDEDNTLTLHISNLDPDLSYCLLLSTCDNCTMRSGWVYLDPTPHIAQYIPYCSTHFRCAWIYLTILGSAILTLSCLLAVCILHCRCIGRKKRRRLSQDDPIPFEGLCLSEAGAPTPAIVPKKTWVELHHEWDTEPPKNPGKILLLYSPDSILFKELQNAFKGFLEQACHCIVLDLFDEELFQSIAFDPELWLTNLLRDDDFKIVVICSEGAYKRQEALLKGEVLNIPDNSSMDGLFSAGLKFIQEQHAYDYNRLGLARYEMLRLTSPECRLEEMVPNREFLIPTQLHDLFCWIHGYDPLDLLGKPWDRYHLEWQLLMDTLKKARMDKK